MLFKSMFNIARFPPSQPRSVSRSGLIVDNMTSPMISEVLWEEIETLQQTLSGEWVNGPMCSGQAAKFKPLGGFWRDDKQQWKSNYCRMLRSGLEIVPPLIKNGHFELSDKFLLK